MTSTTDPKESKMTAMTETATRTIGRGRLAVTLAVVHVAGEDLLQDGNGRIIRVCGKCDGSGHLEHFAYSHEGLCYDCNGNGVGRIYASAESAEKAARRRETDRKRRERKAAEKAAETAAQAEAFLAAHEDLRAAFESAREGSLLEDLGRSLRRWGSLSEAQVALARKVAAEDAERAAARATEKAATTPVVEGRVQITGEIASYRIDEGAYGTVVKILVKDHRGFRVWGSLPKEVAQSLYDEFFADGRSTFDYGSHAWAEIAPGHRITFTATVERSRDDEAFGFYKRPTKASVLD